MSALDFKRIENRLDSIFKNKIYESDIINKPELFTA